ncbi:MAG: hypothetical protein KJZ87_20275 [Thermoguttaceae bacterium]|nr:hypothetical protein [Thermoguttaceae bacterium]
MPAGSPGVNQTIGLITLLVVNGQATNVLRQNGIRVGLLGADMSQLP